MADEEEGGRPLLRAARTFRVSLAGRSIAEALGDLVERQVSAYRRRLAQRDDAAAAEVLAALQASRELQAELATIVDRLERLPAGRKQYGHESRQSGR